MIDEERHLRNAHRMTELYPAFADRVRLVIAELELAGYRPRIQDAYRSPAAQLEADRQGFSKLRYGFHNVTSAHGIPEALAVDVLDDSAPLTPGIGYLVALAHFASLHHCATGIGWGLEPRLQAALMDAVRTNTPHAGLKIGWDSPHVEVAGLSVSAAKKGARPS